MHLLASNDASRRSPIQSSLSPFVDMQGVSLGSSGWTTVWHMLHLEVREDNDRVRTPGVTNVLYGSYNDNTDRSDLQ